MTNSIPIYRTRSKLNRPAFMLLVLYFILFNTIFVPGQLPTIILPGGINLHIADFIIGFLFAIGLFHVFTRPREACRTPLSKFVSLFLSVLLFVVLYSIVVLKQPLTTTFSTFRNFYAYFLFFPVIWALGNERSVAAIIKLWAWLTLFGVLFYIIEFMHGEFPIMQRVNWLYSMSREVGIGGGLNVGGAHFTRIFSNGTVLFRIMLFVSISMWLFSDGRQRWLWGGLAALIAFQVLLQFTRGMYISSIAALALIPFIVNNKRARKRLLNLFILLFAVGILLVIYKLAFSNGHSGGGGLLDFAKDRLFRSFSGVHKDASLEGRIQAWDHFTHALNGHWFFGLGMGQIIVYGDNTYLSFLIKTGIVGLLAFLLLFGIVSFRGYLSYRRILDPYMKAIYLGLWLSTVRHLVNALTQSDFTIGTRVPALIVCVALMEIILHENKKRIRHRNSVIKSSLNAH